MAVILGMSSSQSQLALPARTTGGKDIVQQPAASLAMSPAITTDSEKQPTMRLRGGCCVRYSRGVSIPIIYAYPRNVAHVAPSLDAYSTA